MNREQLEIKITEALDGLLSENELNQLKSELEYHPDLLEAWKLIQSPVDLSVAFPLTEPDAAELEKIRAFWFSDFTTVALHWLPRYLMAAGIAAVVLAGIARFGIETQPTLTDDTVLEWLHTQDDELTLTHVTPLDYPELYENGEE